MTHTTLRSSLFLALRYATLPAMLLAASACLETGVGDEVEDATSEPPQEPEPLSQVALSIEQAERTLDRGEATPELRDSLLALLAEPQITADEKSAAVLALSRAHESLGDEEAAIVVLEKEMASHSDDPGWSSKEFRRRLRELLTGSADRQGLEPRKKVSATPFARLLTKYFPANEDGRVSTKLFMIGGDRDASDDIGTFDVAAGVRAEREESCPLCTDGVDVSSSHSRSDWLMIPGSEAGFGDALLVFYFDLGKNRIPTRYERHLPMPVAEIEAALTENKSFVVARERAGAPPVLLIAAPRTALLEDVEKHLAELDELPTSPAFVDVALRLRPSEIQGVIRDDFFSTARGCYDAVLEEDARASGRVKLRFSILGDGTIDAPKIDASEGNLDREPFLSCMGDALPKVRFPAAGNLVTVSYPLVFTPE